MNTAREIAEYFATVAPDTKFIWQAYTMTDLIDDRITPQVWEEMVRLYDKNPATDEEMGISYLVDVAVENVEQGRP